MEKHSVDNRKPQDRYLLGVPILTNFNMKGLGTIHVSPKGVRINTSLDICSYYQWHIRKAFYNTVKTQLPKYKAHITIANPNIHKNCDFNTVKGLNGKKVTFEYNPQEIFRSRKNFWIPVKFDLEKEIKNLLKIVDSPNYLGLHLTICNMKFENGHVT